MRITRHDQGQGFLDPCRGLYCKRGRRAGQSPDPLPRDPVDRTRQTPGAGKGQEPKQGSVPPLSEMDRADAEQFLENLLLCLPPLGVSFLGPKSPKKQTGVQKFYLSSKLTAQGFVVKEGSQTVRKETKSLPQSYQRLRQRLIEAGIWKTAGNHYVLTRNFAFSSPSAAAAAIRGGSTQGTTSWKTKDRTTLKEWLEASST